MTELEKLKAGMEYSFWDKEISSIKDRAIDSCKKFNKVDRKDDKAVDNAIREMFGSCGSDPFVGPGFNCDYGLNIHVGDRFLANYNVTILDVREVNIGNDVMIGPGTLISTVGHPLSPKGRRNHLGIAKPVTIGNDVWIGGNVTILPGVTIGNNVVVAAGAVVTKDVPDNCLVGGIPARKIKDIENDTED